MNKFVNPVRLSPSTIIKNYLFHDFLHFKTEAV